MPHEDQQGGSRTVYRSEQARMLVTKPQGVILSIRCMSEADARKWLGEANRLNAKQDVIEHFVDEIKRLKD